MTTKLMDFYKFVINNVAKHIKSDENKALIQDGLGMNAFEASVVLAIVFCKNKEEIIEDIIFSETLGN